REVTELWVGELDDPANTPILGIETDQMRVGRSKVEPILVHAQSAIADVVAFGNTQVVPNLTPKASVDSPHVVGRREIENAVHFQRGRFDRGPVRLKDPGECKRAD